MSQVTENATTREEDTELTETNGQDKTGVDDMKKAQHTRNQLLVWDDFMAIRMLLQPVHTHLYLPHILNSFNTRC